MSNRYRKLQRDPRVASTVQRLHGETQASHQAAAAAILAHYEEIVFGCFMAGQFQLVEAAEMTSEHVQLLKTCTQTLSGMRKDGILPAEMHQILDGLTSKLEANLPPPVAAPEPAPVPAPLFIVDEPAVPRFKKTFEVA